MAKNTVITFELLPVITLLVKISTMVNTVVTISLQRKGIFIEVQTSLSERFCTCYSHPVFWVRVLLKCSLTQLVQLLVVTLSSAMSTPMNPAMNATMDKALNTAT